MNYEEIREMLSESLSDETRRKMDLHKSMQDGSYYEKNTHEPRRPQVTALIHAYKAHVQLLKERHPMADTVKEVIKHLHNSLD